MQRAGMKSWVAVLFACAIVAVAARVHAQGTAASIQGVSINFGCYNGEIPVLPATNPNFGVPSCTVDNTSRRLQLGVRYAF